MGDKSSFGSNNKPQISEGLQNFINAMVEEIILKGEHFDEQKKKWLKKYVENESLNYTLYEKELCDFLESLTVYNKTESEAVKRMIKAHSELCYIKDNTFFKLINVEKSSIELPFIQLPSFSSGVITSGLITSGFEGIVGVHLLELPEEKTNKPSITMVNDFPVKNEYKSVIIGSQIWMVDNLNIDRFRNGDPIPEAQSESLWLRAAENKTPAWCYFDNNLENIKNYGKLYNWYAIIDYRGFAPEGWHIPTETEWKELIYYLGKGKNAIASMKSRYDWDFKSGSGNNSSGFTALPSGRRNDKGKFDHLFNEIESSWWSISEGAFLPWNKGKVAWACFTNFLKPTMPVGKGFGCGVRCIKD